MGYIPESVEEAFFERYFEIGDELEIVKKNAAKAIRILKAAHTRAAEISSAAQTGECFDESEAILVFQTISLSGKYAEEFIGMIPEEEAKPFRDAMARILAE